MWITLRHDLPLRPVTVNYPYESLAMPARFRGHVELIRDDETGEPNCVVCMACQKACPSDCIRVEGHKPEGAHTKDADALHARFHHLQPLRPVRGELQIRRLASFPRSITWHRSSKEDYQMDLLQRGRKETL